MRRSTPATWDAVLEVDLEAIASMTPGMVGADLANLVNEAALLAGRRGKQQVDRADLEEALERVVAGLEKKNRVLSPKEKERVAHHELGHALVAMALPGQPPVRASPMEMGLLPSREREHGAEVERVVDAEVRRLLETALSRAGSILSARRSLLERAAGRLLAHEVLEGEELEAMMAADGESAMPSAAPH